jgi:regulator of nucleoside diphosphate kinase
LSRQVYITENDRIRLKKLISDALLEGLQSDKSFGELNMEIEKAKVVDIKQLPGDVITMNSKILIQLGENEEEVTLVYPQEADLIENKISVLSPIGTAILGYREGDTVEWTVPSGVMEVKVKKILYQPEAAGDLDL